ncbi:MAG: TIGR01777 family oxidoreductase [Anaerolineae bacterium]
MRVIITGGTGFLGSRLAESLAADGHEVIVLSRSPEKGRARFKGAVRVEQWDGKTAAGWGGLADGADAIVNLAGESIAGEGIPPARWTPARKRRILESRLNAGAAVIEAIRAAAQKPKVLLQGSAVGYYGPRGDEPVTEETGPGTDFLARVCVEWEDAVSEAAGLGVRTVYLRTGLPISPQGGVFPLVLLPFRLFVGGPLGSGRQYFPWIHIDDHIRAMRFLLEHPEASGPFNLSAPEPVTNRELSRAIGRVMGRPSFFAVPAFVLKLALGELSTLVLEGQRQLPSRLQALGFAFRFPQLEGALRDLLGK